MTQKKIKKNTKNKTVTLVEVGPRDGLQNEKAILTRKTKLEFIKRLAAAGVSRIEIGAFVSPKWVPQMANSHDVCVGAIRLQKTGQIDPTVELSALVPNAQGMEAFLTTGLNTMGIFTSASESFSRRNINCSISESLHRYSLVMRMAKKNAVRTRAYISMCFGCPYEGYVDEAQVVTMAKKLIEMGAYEISIGDTIGVAHPKQVESLVLKLKRAIGIDKVALHFHDTRGTALANILKGLELGVRVFDTSLGGLGGCPYAVGASGNVATEDVVYMLQGMGYNTGIDLEKLPAINRMMVRAVGRDLPSHVGNAGAAPPFPIQIK